MEPKGPFKLAEEQLCTGHVDWEQLISDTKEVGNVACEGINVAIGCDNASEFKR